MQTTLELILLMATLTMAATWWARYLSLSQTEIVQESPIGARPGDRLYAWNRAPRYPLHCEVRFADENRITGRGRLLDISRTGWRIRSSCPLLPETGLELTVLLPDRPEPLTVDHAIVRWSDGHEFGGELVAMAPESAARLSDFFLQHVAAPKDTSSAVPETVLHG